MIGIVNCIRKSIHTARFDDTFLISLLVINFIYETANVYSVLESSNFIWVHNCWSIHASLSIQDFACARECWLCYGSSKIVCYLILTETILLHLSTLLQSLQKWAWKWAAHAFLISLKSLLYIPRYRTQSVQINLTRLLPHVVLISYQHIVVSILVDVWWGHCVRAHRSIRVHIASFKILRYDAVAYYRSVWVIIAEVENSVGCWQTTLILIHLIILMVLDNRAWGYCGIGLRFQASMRAQSAVFQGSIYRVHVICLRWVSVCPFKRADDALDLCVIKIRKLIGPIDLLWLCDTSYSQSTGGIWCPYRSVARWSLCGFLLLWFEASAVCCFEVAAFGVSALLGPACGAKVGFHGIVLIEWVLVWILQLVYQLIVDYLLFLDFLSNAGAPQVPLFRAQDSFILIICFWCGGLLCNHQASLLILCFFHCCL